MSQQKVRVALNGYGVIGKRIADAVATQADMELVGAADGMVALNSTLGAHERPGLAPGRYVGSGSMG